MVRGRTQPNIPCRFRRWGRVCRPQYADLVVERCGQPFDQSRHIELHDVDVDSDPGKILLEERQHLGTRLVAGVGNDGELYGMPGIVKEPPVLQLPTQPAKLRLRRGRVVSGYM